MRIAWLAAACAFVFAPLAAQDSTRTVQDSAVRVFLDCPDTFCDFDYYRTEITFVNWVRDRTYAQVHVLVTTQQTGGGQEFTLAFIGLERFAGTADTLRWVSQTTDTEDDRRRGVAHTLRLGLTRFAARTPAGRRLDISYSAPASEAAAVRDPWNYWVFRLSMNGNIQGEKTLKFQNWFGSLSADRVTDAWKLRLSLNQSYNQSDFTVDVLDSLGNPTGTEVITSITRSYNASGLVVRSLSPHWSFGARASASSSTFLNQDLAAAFAPAIEYDAYPYTQSTRRLLTVRYELGVKAFRYTDTTIFNRTAETRFNQALSVSLSVKQPWGSTSLALEGSNYLYDFRKNRVSLFGSGEFRVYKGLSFNLFGSVALIHDQLFLPKAGASEQEVLLRRRQLATSYSYFTFFGISYTFGSKFANVVNPRFEGGGGSFFIIN